MLIFPVMKVSSRKLRVQRLVVFDGMKHETLTRSLTVDFMIAIALHQFLMPRTILASEQDTLRMFGQCRSM